MDVCIFIEELTLSFVVRLFEVGDFGLLFFFGVFLVRGFLYVSLGQVLRSGHYIVRQDKVHAFDDSLFEQPLEKRRELSVVFKLKVC